MLLLATLTFVSIFQQALTSFIVPKLIGVRELLKAENSLA
jgi:hypothetical protein